MCNGDVQMSRFDWKCRTVKQNEAQEGDEYVVKEFEGIIQALYLFFEICDIYLEKFLESFTDNTCLFYFSSILDDSAEQTDRNFAMVEMVDRYDT